MAVLERLGHVDVHHVRAPRQGLRGETDLVVVHRLETERIGTGGRCRELRCRGFHRGHRDRLAGGGVGEGVILGVGVGDGFGMKSAYMSKIALCSPR